MFEHFGIANFHTLSPTEKMDWGEQLLAKAVDSSDRSLMALAIAAFQLGAGQHVEAHLKTKGFSTQDIDAMGEMGLVEDYAAEAFGEVTVRIANMDKSAKDILGALANGDSPTNSR